MAVNTGFEALEVLAVQVKSIEADVATAKKEYLAVGKATAPAANKSDEMKKLYDLLVKRIVKLKK
jgi:predicted phage tail protein